MAKWLKIEGLIITWIRTLIKRIDKKRKSRERKEEKRRISKIIRD